LCLFTGIIPRQTVAEALQQAREHGADEGEAEPRATLTLVRSEMERVEGVERGERREREREREREEGK